MSSLGSATARYVGTKTFRLDTARIRKVIKVLVRGKRNSDLAK